MSHNFATTTITLQEKGNFSASSSRIWYATMLDMEQFTKADLLAVMLSADVWFVLKKQDSHYGKKARQLAQAA